MAKPASAWRIGLAVAASFLVVAVIAAVRTDVPRAILASFMGNMARTSGPLTPLKQTQNLSPVQRPEFDAASIRPCDPGSLGPVPDGARGGGANSFHMTPGRTYVLCMTLATIIRTAYGYGPVDLEFLKSDSRGVGPAGEGLKLESVYGLGVEDGRRVRGGPTWIRDQRYTIEASAGTAADAATMQGPMLRALLEKRFKLEVHVETEEVPAFDVVVAKGGLKVKPVQPENCEPSPSANGPAVRKLDEVRRGARPTCGLHVQPHGPNVAFILGGETLDDLARFLGGPLGGVRVVDKTGTSDVFNLILEFALDDNTPGRRFVPPVQEESADVSRAPTIFTAIREQLGLELVKSRTPREFLVIHHVEKPAPDQSSAAPMRARGIGR